MQTITTQYSVEDSVWFIDIQTKKIIRGAVDKIYITSIAAPSSSPQTHIKYLIKANDGMFYTTTEDYMSDDTFELLDIIQNTIDTGIC